MRIKGIANGLRVVAVKVTAWGEKTIRLKVQIKTTALFFYWWHTVKKLDIQVENYWGYIPGHELLGRHMTMHDAYGGRLEIWPPDIFNLDNRMSSLAAEYIGERAEKIEANDTIKRQMKEQL